MVVAAGQLFLCLVSLPGHRGKHACDFQRVGGVGKLIGMYDDDIAGRSTLDGKRAVHHLLVEFQEQHRVLGCCGPAG